MQWQSLLDNINRKVATPSLIGEINDNRNEFKLISLIMSNSTIK